MHKKYSSLTTLMKKYNLRFILTVSLYGILFAQAQETRELAIYRPFAVVDLKTIDGAAAVGASWKVKPAIIKDALFKAPGPSDNDPFLIYPTGKQVKTNNLNPNLSDPDFNTIGWQNIEADKLEQRLGNGLLSHVWYKTDIVLPTQIGGKNINGTSVYFEITADDYSEVYIDGVLKKQFGQTGAGVISGYNARNRLLLTSDAKAGQHFSIAVLVTNGPIGNEPDNYVWIRNAVLDFYETDFIKNSHEKVGKVWKMDNGIDKLLDANEKVEKLADGFTFTEGPVWHPDGFLLFSDPNMNMIYRFNPGNNNVTIYQSHSGYTGMDIGEIGQPGSNGLAIDNKGLLVVCQQGNRRVIREEKKGPVTVLADRYEGKRLNSPNDLTIKSDGTLYFTDPPYGLPGFYNSPKKETDFNGVYMVKNGKISLVATDCGGPNGIAFSPDEKYLYVTNWDIRDIHNTKTIWRYEVQPDGTLKNGKIFYDFSYSEDEEALDGMKVDFDGNLYVSAPGGLSILSPNAKLLGKITMPERPANMAWGGADGKTLYLTAHTGLYRILTKTGGKIATVKP